MDDKKRTDQTKAPSEVDVRAGARVRSIRHDRGLSQTALAEAVGITFQQIQKYEKGANRIGMSRLQRIAEALAVPVTSFFDQPDQDAAVLPLIDRTEYVRISDPILRKQIQDLVNTFERSVSKRTNHDVPDK